MKTTSKLLTFLLLLLAVCAQAGDFGDLPKYERANPDIDLKAAIARNDLRFKALMGYAVYLPGIADYDEKYAKYGYEVIEGTSDVIGSYEQGRLTAIAQYYAENYNLALFQYIDHLESVELSKNLAGYDQLISEMKIESETTGLINSLPESFHAQLVSRKPRCVNLAWWFDPITNGKPSYSWRQFLETYEQVDEAVCQHKWIQEWINAGSNRNAEAQIFGLRSYTETMFDFYVKSAWENAGLDSEPYYEINLRKGSDWFGTIFIGKDKRMALVTVVNERKLNPPSNDDAARRSSHWLDAISAFSFHPKDDNKEYVVVDRNGKWRKEGKPQPDNAGAAPVK